MGNEESHPYKHVSLKIKGMDCPDCAQTIQKNISLMPRVRNVRLDFDMAILEADVSGKTGKDDIEAAIRSLGYAIQKAEPFPFLQKNRKSILTFLSGVLAIGGVTLSYLDFSSEAVIGVYGLSIIIGGYHIARKGIVSLKLLTFDMNLLMSVAVLGACILGEWLEGASVVFLFSLAQLLESYSADKARNAIKSLLNLAPPSSLVRRNGEERVVPACDVEVGETMIIRPGERVALDGLIFKGFSHVNQSPVTGESMPQEKKEGDRIFAGSFNIDGVLEAKVTAPSHNTTLARIIALVEKSHAKKAPMVSYVERFARIYTPAVIGVALFMAVVPPLIFGEARVWFYRSLVLLVISCPCALVISTPVTIVSGLASGARHGILVKGGLSLERMGSVDVIAFDKTGTLTHGQPSLTDIVASPGFSEEEVLSISASCEHHSEHPLGIAVVRRAQEMGLPLMETKEFSVHPGKGIRAKIDGKRALLGNERFMESEGIKPYPLKEEAVRLSGEGKTIVFLGMGERLAGILAFADTLKENAHKTVEELKGLMVDVIVLSGDNAKTTETIAIQAGIDHVRAGIHPEDKASEIKRLQGEGKKVAMVGDGINDAPALAQADVGIAMGALGSDVAIETADIALMADDLSKIAYVMTLSKKTTGIIKENIIFALLTKAVFFILALAGVATLWSAVFADMGASLIVIANGLRLLQWKG